MMKVGYFMESNIKCGLLLILFTHTDRVAHEANCSVRLR